MAAHMFVMYFGMLSMITPPVAIAAYAAANIARVSGWTTGWNAVLVGWSTFFIPFLFVTEPSMLFNDTWLSIGWNFTRNILGIVVGTAALVGYFVGPLSWPFRVFFGVAGVAILVPPHVFPGAEIVDWVGLGGAAAGIVVHYMQTKSTGQRSATPSTTA
jgi:TRAP-type uncharacterized transport system fused permease subunit